MVGRWDCISVVGRPSLTAPMVLLGVASTRFGHLFWKWFAPLFVMLVALAMIFEENMPLAERIGIFAGGVGILVILYVGLGGRRMRNVVPLLSILICLILGAMFLLNAGMNVFTPCMENESIVANLIGLAFFIASLCLAYRVVFSMLGWLTRGYERKHFSDSQFQVGAWMLVITLLFAMAPGPKEVGLNLW